jgi:alkylhydroperoxidase family enzyme
VSADHMASSGTDSGLIGQAEFGRIPSGGFRQLGLINWVAAKLSARKLRAPRMHLFATLGQHKRLFWLFLPYTLGLLSGRLPNIDTELVVLRVAHLRSSEYELVHHRRIGQRHGLDAEKQGAIFAWPDASEALRAGLTQRQQTLLRATDQFVLERTIGDETWKQLSEHLNKRQLIEFCMLAGQYDALAATISALRIPPDQPR